MRILMNMFRTRVLTPVVSLTTVVVFTDDMLHLMYYTRRARTIRYYDSHFVCFNWTVCMISIFVPNELVTPSQKFIVAKLDNTQTG